MKILNLTIKNEKEKIIRTINFLENDLFFVYGDVEKPKDKKKTSNSIGKTLLLKMCDYIFGCKYDIKIAKSIIASYILYAEINYNGIKHNVQRKLNENDIILDGSKISLSEYCSKLNINRNFLSHQIQLNSKGSLLGYNKNATQSDYVEFLKLLNLNNLSDLANEYYNLRSKIESLEKTKKELLLIADISEKQLSQEIYMNEKKIKEVSSIIDDANGAIKKLEISENTALLQKEYESINLELKKIQIEISKLTNEEKNLKNFIDDTNKNDVSINSIRKMFSKMQYQVPEMIYKKIEEVEKFYKSVIEDRIKNINSRIVEIESNLNSDNNLKKEYIEKLDTIGKKLSNDGIYQSAINTLNENNKIFSDLKYEQGKLYQLKSVINEISVLSTEISNKHNNLKDFIKINDELINDYKDFIYNIIQSIYDKNVKAYFDINISNYKKGCIPIHVDLSVTGETGEGISEVKKDIIDILLFKYTTLCDVLILDSSCFNGIDPRQVSGLLSIIRNICVENNKQAIVSINKSQIDQDYLLRINENNILRLSEKEKLLFIDF